MKKFKLEIHLKIMIKLFQKIVINLFLLKILVIQNLIGSFKLIKFTLEMDLNKILSINFNIEGFKFGFYENNRR